MQKVTLYQIDAAMSGPDWELREGATMRGVAQALETACHERGWEEIVIEAVNSHNGARNVTADGRPLDELMPSGFDDLFWEIAEQFNGRVP